MARKPFQVGTIPKDHETFMQTVGAMLQQVQRGMPRGPSAETHTRSFTVPDGLQSEHVLYRCDATAGVLTVTLPKSATSADTTFTLKRTNGGSNVVTWVTQGADTVDGSTTGNLATQYSTIRLHCRTGGYDVF